MIDAAYLIPAFPLLGFALLLLMGEKVKEPVGGALATLCSFAAFGATVAAFVGLLGEDAHHRTETLELFDWIPAVGVKMAFLVDPLSMTMALFVTGVGSLIHLFAVGYMHGDPRFNRFFLYLNLFLVSMLLLVLGDNFLVTFLGWEGVGTCSYLLISFWFERDSAATAAKKAFVTNRVGDVGFMLAMFLIFAKVGSLTYSKVFEGVEHGAFSSTTATAVALLLFVGAAGKSAQLPLYIWLPDAMEGPTPVSALIHAATMVTAGVYVLCRVNPFFAEGLGSDALIVVAWVGGATALFAATIACAQNDIKRVLAYSTISQLGYMFLAVGSRAYVAAIFHMVTHAFFKALMFLGSGSVIHGMHDEQDMKRMGNLRRYMPITAGTFIIGWLAIAGVPPLAGFWSKDEILLSAWEEHGFVLYGLGLVTALLTAYYMTRQIMLVFFGDERYPEHDGHKVEPHESPLVMWAPLAVLAGLSVVGGAINLAWFDYPLEHFLEPVFEAGHPLHLEAGTSDKVVFAAIATVAGLVGIAAGVALWRRGAEQPNLEPQVLRRGWYVDSGVSALFGGPGRAGATALSDGVDARGIDGAVNGIAALVRTGGSHLRRLQTGYVRNYALGLTVGIVLLLAYVIIQLGV